MKWNSQRGLRVACEIFSGAELPGDDDLAQRLVEHTDFRLCG